MNAHAESNGNSAGEAKNRYWVSFDLGLMGNYSHIYEWLDAMDAQECGPGLATVVTEKDLVRLESEIRELIGDAPRARIYLIGELVKGRFAGKFLAGGRKSAPWVGFAARAVGVVDEA
jgi:hypothetical protein